MFLEIEDLAGEINSASESHGADGVQGDPKSPKARHEHAARQVKSSEFNPARDLADRPRQSFRV